VATDLLKDLVREIPLHPVREDGGHLSVRTEVIKDLESGCEI
jgi:hypothetical protein